MPRPRQFDGFPSTLRDLAPFGPYPAYVDHVHDGDTVLIIADCGLDEQPAVWIRLKDLAAPEEWEPGGPEATEKLKSLLPPDTHCVAITTKTPRSRREKQTFTRYEAVLILDGGAKVNDLMNQCLASEAYSKAEEDLGEREE